MSNEGPAIDPLAPPAREALWSELASRNDEQAAPARRALGLWCVAREPLPFSMVARLVDCPGAAARDRLKEATLPFLIEQTASRSDGEIAQAPSSDDLRAFVLDKLGPDAVAAAHGALGAWPPARRGHRRYALQHAIHHRIEAGSWARVQQLGFDTGYLLAQCREMGVEQIQADLGLVRAHPQGAAPGPWAELSRAIDQEAERLRRNPLALPSLLYNRMLCGALSRDEVAKLLPLPPGSPRLRLEHPPEGARSTTNTTATPPGGHAREVRACAITPDGKRAVSASVVHTLEVQDLETGKVLFTLRGHTGPVSSCAVTPDGGRVVSGAEDGTVLAWDLPASTSEQPAPPRLVSAFGESTIASVQLGLDGKTVVYRLFLTGTPGSFVNWSPLDAPPETPPRLLWSSEGVQSAYANELDALQRQRDELLYRLQTIDARMAELAALMIPPEARRDTLGGPDSGDPVPTPMEPDPTDAEPPAPTREAEVAPTPFEATSQPCAMTPDELQLLVAAGSGVVVLQLDPLLNGQNITLEGHTDRVTALALAPDGQRLVTGSCDHTIRIRDLRTSRCLAVLSSDPAPITALAITPDGRRLISAAADTLRVWDLDSHACLGAYPGEADFTSVAAAQERVVAGDVLGNVWMFGLSEPETPGKGDIVRTGRIKKRHALLIGVNGYLDQDLKPLPFCVNDVRDLGRVLDERDYDVISLHDEQAESFRLPTRENIRAELSLLRLDHDDLLLVHFSCHGVRVGGIPYLFPRDCRNDSIPETALAVQEVIAWMAASGARRQVLLIDACYAGVSLFGRSEDAPAVNLEAVGQALPEAPADASTPREPPSTRNDPRDLHGGLYRSEGLALLTASSAVQESFDRETRPNSLFSSLVIDGLAGRADGDGRGFVTVDDLKNYVAAGTSKLVDGETGKLQTPTAQLLGTGDMILTSVLE